MASGARFGASYPLPFGKPGTAALLAVALCALAGAATPSVIDKLDSLRTGLLVPSVVVLAAAAAVSGGPMLLYLLSIAWVFPISMAGTAILPVTQGITAWELVLYAGAAIAVFRGQIRVHLRIGPDSRGGARFLAGPWIGWILILLGSLLASFQMNSFGYGNFRYAAVDPLIVFLLTTSLIKTRRDLYRVALALCVGALLLLVIQVIPGFDLSQGRLFVRVQSPFDLEEMARGNRVGLWTSTFVPLALGVGIGADRRVVRYFALLLCLAMMVVTVMTMSRGSIVAAVVGAVLVAFLGLRTGHARRLAAAVGLLGALVMVTTRVASEQLLELATQFSIDEATYRLQSFSNLFAEDRSVESRIGFWRTSMDLLPANPMGIGYGTLVPMVGAWEHNLFILILNGGGVVALTGLVVFLVSYTRATLLASARAFGFVKLACIAAMASAVTTTITGLSMEILAPNYAEPVLLVLGFGFAAVRVAYAELPSGGSSGGAGGETVADKARLGPGANDR